MSCFDSDELVVHNPEEDADLCLTQDVTIATCRAHHIPDGRLNLDSAMAYFSACNVSTSGCRLALGEDERGFFVHLWRRVLLSSVVNRESSRRFVWKRKFSEMPSGRTGATDSDHIDLCDSGHDAAHSSGTH